MADAPPVTADAHHGEAALLFPFSSSASSLYHTCVRADGAFEWTEVASLLVHSPVPLAGERAAVERVGRGALSGWSGEWRPAG
jgi:hypothetical protein